MAPASNPVEKAYMVSAPLQQRKRLGGSATHVSRFDYRLLLRLMPLPGYLLLLIFMTWPLALELGSKFPADQGSDMLVHQWTMYWLKQSVLSLQNPFFTDLLAYPAGVSLTSHNIAWVNFGLWLPWSYALGQGPATGVTYLLIFTVNAYAMYLFALEQTGSRAGAWVAGVIFGCFPITLSDGGHINMLLVGWLPLSLLYIDRVIRVGGRRNVFMAGLFLALLGISRWQLLAIGAIPIAIFGLWKLAVDAKRVTLRTIVELAGAGAVALLIMAPFLLPVVVAQVTRAHAGDLLVYEPAFAADLLGYFVPHSHLPFWQWLTTQLPSNLVFTNQEITFLGYGALTLAAFALALRFSKSLPWAVMLLVLLVLAMGPVITVGQTKLEWLYTPYRLIEDSFYNHFIRKPWRYHAFAGLPLAMLSAITVQAVLGDVRRAGKVWKVAFVGGLSLLILAEYWMAPYPLMTTDQTTPWYRQLALDPEQYAIAAMPFSSRFADKFFMYYQMDHHKPMVGGHVSRPPRESTSFIGGSRFLAGMLQVREMDEALVDVSHQLRYLADANVRYLILHKNFVSQEKIKAWKDWLTFDPVYEDETVVVYRTAPTAGVDFAVVSHLTPELGIVSARYESEDVQQGQRLAFNIRWGATNAVGTDYDYCINLIADDGSVVQKECAPISPEWRTSHWLANEVARSDHSLQIDPFLPQDEYQVTISLRDVRTGKAAGSELHLDSLQVNRLPRSYETPAPQHPAAVNLGPDIKLLGYDRAVEGQDVSLVLYWSTERRLQRRYKVFVHAVDSRTGAIVAQHDAAPRDWTYPTTWWEADEIVTDPISLVLPDANLEGIYLLVGMYDEVTGERLPLTLPPTGTPAADNALWVPLE